MVDNKSAPAETRRGKKEKKKKEEEEEEEEEKEKEKEEEQTTGQNMSASATQGGHNNTKAYKELELSANAKRNGLPAEYRWRPLFCCAMMP